MRIRIRNNGELISGMHEIKENDTNNIIENSGNLSNNFVEGLKFNQGKNIITIKLNDETQNRNSVNKKLKEAKNIGKKYGDMDEE